MRKEFKRVMEKMTRLAKQTSGEGLEYLQNTRKSPFKTEVICVDAQTLLSYQLNIFVNCSSYLPLHLIESYQMYKVVWTPDNIICLASFPGLPRFLFFGLCIIHRLNANRRTRNGGGLGTRL